MQVGLPHFLDKFNFVMLLNVGHIKSKALRHRQYTETSTLSYKGNHFTFCKSVTDVGGVRKVGQRNRYCKILQI